MIIFLAKFMIISQLKCVLYSFSRIEKLFELFDKKKIHAHNFSNTKISTDPESIPKRIPILILLGWPGIGSDQHKYPHYYYLMVACLSFNLLHYDRTTYFNFISHSVCSVLPFAKYYLYFIEPILKNFQYLPASLNLFDGRQNNNNITNIANNKSFFCWIESLVGIF